MLVDVNEFLNIPLERWGPQGLKENLPNASYDSDVHRKLIKGLLKSDHERFKRIFEEFISPLILIQNGLRENPASLDERISTHILETMAGYINALGPLGILVPAKGLDDRYYSIIEMCLDFKAPQHS